MGATFSKSTSWPLKLGSRLSDGHFLQIASLLPKISPVEFKPLKRKVDNMEVELTLINEILEGLTEKVTRMKNEPCKLFSVLRREAENLKSEFDNLAREVAFRDDIEKRAMDQLKRVDKDCVKLKEEMASEIPSWSLPQEPWGDDEAKLNFSHYADYLSECVQYLLGLKFACSEQIFHYGTHLYGLRRDIDDAVKFYRHNSSSESFWESTVRMRNKLYFFGLKIDDVCGTYFESKSEKEKDLADPKVDEGFEEDKPEDEEDSVEGQLPKCKDVPRN